MFKYRQLQLSLRREKKEGDHTQTENTKLDFTKDVKKYIVFQS